MTTLPLPPPPVTVKLLELVTTPPPAVTEIVPEVAPVGTVAVILMSEFTVNDALVPLKVTVEAVLKPEPLIVTLLPTAPLPGEKLVSVGAGAPSTLARRTAATLAGRAVKNEYPVSA